MRRAFIIPAVLASFVAGGCHFSRAVVNPHHRTHNTSWIEPGKTTRAEVIERIGLPPSTIQGRGGIKDDSFRWLTRDTFTGTLEAGYIVTPTFEVSRERYQHDLLITFDDHGIVQRVSRTETVNGVTRIHEWREVEK